MAFIGVIDVCRVQKHIVNAAKVFIEDEVRSPCENLAVKFCDLPPHRFVLFYIECSIGYFYIRIGKPILRYCWRSRTHI